MKKLRRLIEVLSEEEIAAIQTSFTRESDKIARLFAKLLAHVPASEIRAELDMSQNAFTTLGSRLKNKIENQLVAIDESPKDDLLRKLQNIDDILFTEEPTRALATLKKLEIELRRYDLSNQLTVVYKHLKRFYLNSPEYFTYSKLYNQHIAYSLALDKAEDILGNYFREYGYYFVMKDREREVKLKALFEEMLNVSDLYTSHRMQIYKAAMEIVHRLNVDPEVYRKYDSVPLEDLFEASEKIFNKYPRDSIYVHLKLIFKVFRFEYYFIHKVYDKAEQLLDEVKPAIPRLLVHYENYGFPAQLLDGLILTGLRNDSIYVLPVEIPKAYLSEPSMVMLYVYYSLVAFYQEDYEVASRQLFALSNRVKFKDYPELFAEVKCLIALVKYQQHDASLFTQNYAAAQRLLRRLDKAAIPGLVALHKYLGILAGKSEIDRFNRLTKMLEQLEESPVTGYQPGRYLLPALKKIAEKFNSA